MATRSRGNGTNFGWLKKSCDISTCDLSPDGNPEKYGRALKSAILTVYLKPNKTMALIKNQGASFTVQTRLLILDCD